MWVWLHKEKTLYSGFGILGKMPLLVPRKVRADLLVHVAVPGWLLLRG